MKLELSITPKEGVKINISKAELNQLVQQNVITVIGDLISFKVPIAVINSKVDDIAEFVNTKFNPLFPTDSISGGDGFGDYRVSGNQEFCVKYLKEFLKIYPQYDLFTIWVATCVYLGEKAKFNYRGCLKNFNFIRRELEVLCVYVTNNPDESLLKAKAFIKHAQQQSTKLRAKFLKRFDIAKQLHESFGGIAIDNAEIRGIANGGNSEVESSTSVSAIPITPNGTGGGIVISKPIGDSGSGASDGQRYILPSEIKPVTNWGINPTRKQP